MLEERGRASWLSGLWVCVTGAVLLVVLMLSLDPVTRQQDCPNYGGNGNASAFSNRSWDLYLPLLLVGWVGLVILQQVLPVTWRHRSRLNGTVRATTAILVSLSGFWVAAPLEVVCR